MKKLERRVFHLEERFAKLSESVLRDGANCDYQTAHYRGLFDAWHSGLEKRMALLASAVGYEWVPEGRVVAHWRKKEPKK